MKKHRLIKALFIVIMICFCLLPRFQCESAGGVVTGEEAAATVPMIQYFYGSIFDEFSETEPCTDQKCSTNDYCGGTPYVGGALCLRPDEIVGSEGVHYNNGQPDLTNDDVAHHEDEHDGGGRNFPTATAAAAVFRRPYAHVEGLVQDSRQHKGDSSSGDGDNKNLLKPQPYVHKLCCCVDDYDQSNYASDDDDDDIEEYHAPNARD